MKILKPVFIVLIIIALVLPFSFHIAGFENFLDVIIIVLISVSYILLYNIHNTLKRNQKNEK